VSSDRGWGVSGLTHKKERQGTVINGLDCGFLQLVVVTSEELEYMKVRTHKVGARASEAA
jgi:hypothetical protein